MRMRQRKEVPADGKERKRRHEREASLRTTRQQSENVQKMEVQAMEEHKIFYTSADIASDLSIDEREAVELVRELHKELKASGKLVVSGKVPAVWYELRKAEGFMGIGNRAEHIPLTERRLLSIKDFRAYAGGIGDGMARKLAKEICAVVHIGDRLMVDRLRFDEWCADQNQQRQQ